MKKATLPITISVLVFLTTMCADEPEEVIPETTPVVELEAALALPNGNAFLDGDDLNVTISGLEELEHPAGYVAWLVATDGSVTALGAVEAGALLVTLPEGVASGTILVTEEVDESAIPAEPSSRLRLEGLIGGDLTFPPGYAGDTHFHGHVEILDVTVEATFEDLPAPPEGLYYSLWAMWAEDDDAHDDDGHDGDDDGHMDDEHDDDGHDDDGHDDDGHDDDGHDDTGHDDGGHDDDGGRDDGDEVHHESGRHENVGSISDSGSLAASHGGDLATCDHFIVTLESELGTHEASPIVILFGLNGP